MVLDVGFIGLLTRCRSGLTGMVATPGRYRRRRRSACSSRLTVPVARHCCCACILYSPDNSMLIEHTQVGTLARDHPRHRAVWLFMNSEIEDMTEPEDGPFVSSEAIDRAMRRIAASGLSESEAERLNAALRGVVNTIETWRQIGDLRPHEQPFRDFGTAVLPQLIEELPQLHRFRDWLPTNWRDKPSLSLDSALQVIREGIPLIWVPRAAIVSDLFVRSAEDRLRLLASSVREISQDCLAVLSQISDPELRELVPMASAAARALEDGYPWPAQALAANILDTWMRDAVDRGVFRIIGHRRLYAQVADNIEAVSDDTTLERFRKVCVLAPVAVALSEYRPSYDPVPVHFNRHASAHRVGHEQYSLANAVVGVMLVSSVLREAEESGL